MVGGGYYEMTRKQFEWIRLHQDIINVSYFKIYECKTPKNFHYLYPCKIKMELRGNYFIFSGTYSKWNGGVLMSITHGIEYFIEIYVN